MLKTSFVFAIGMVASTAYAQLNAPVTLANPIAPAIAAPKIEAHAFENSASAAEIKAELFAADMAREEGYQLIHQQPHHPVAFKKKELAPIRAAER